MLRNRDRQEQVLRLKNWDRQEAGARLLRNRDHDRDFRVTDLRGDTAMRRAMAEAEVGDKSGRQRAKSPI
jgi:hypothetical protein